LGGRRHLPPHGRPPQGPSDGPQMGTPPPPVISQTASADIATLVAWGNPAAGRRASRGRRVEDSPSVPKAGSSLPPRQQPDRVGGDRHAVDRTIVRERRGRSCRHPTGGRVEDRPPVPQAGNIPAPVSSQPASAEIATLWTGPSCASVAAGAASVPRAAASRTTRRSHRRAWRDDPVSSHAASAEIATVQVPSQGVSSAAGAAAAPWTLSLGQPLNPTSGHRPPPRSAARSPRLRRRTRHWRPDLGVAEWPRSAPWRRRGSARRPSSPTAKLRPSGADATAYVLEPQSTTKPLQRLVP
jgi:hypothetical protein